MLMLFVGLWRWYINITITILDIIHRPVFYLKHGVSEAGFCLRLQLGLTQVGPIDIANPCLWPGGGEQFCWLDPTEQVGYL
jgi:hypothetical protein